MEHHGPPQTQTSSATTHPGKVDTSTAVTRGFWPRLPRGKRLNVLLEAGICALFSVVFLNARLHIVPAAAVDFFKELKVGKDGTADCRHVQGPVEFQATIKNHPPISRVTLKCPPNAKVTPPDPSKEACGSEACFKTFPLALGHGLLGSNTCISVEGNATSPEGITWIFDMRKYAMWSNILEDLLESEFYFKCEGVATSLFPGGVPCLLKIEVDIEGKGSGTTRTQSVTAFIKTAFLVSITTFVAFLQF